MKQFLKRQRIFIKKYGILRELARVKREIISYLKEIYEAIKYSVVERDFKERAREDLKIVKRVFGKKGVRFFLIYGTLLGAVREGDFIEWDDDIDLGVVEEVSLETKKEIWEELRKEGFRIVRNSEYELSTDTLCKRKTITAIFWFKREKEDFVLWNRDREFGVKIPARLFEKFREANLGEEKFLIPDLAEDFLDKAYGDWGTPNKKQNGKLLI